MKELNDFVKKKSRINKIIRTHYKIKGPKRSPDIGSQNLNNVKLGQGQPRLLIETYFVYHIWE